MKIIGVKSYSVGLALVGLSHVLQMNNSFAAASFGFGGSLKVVGGNPTATLLQNGKILLAGGTSGVPVSSAELYDPFAATSVATASMTTNRVNHTATLLPNGK